MDNIFYGSNFERIGYKVKLGGFILLKLLSTILLFYFWIFSLSELLFLNGMVWELLSFFSIFILIFIKII